MAKDQRLYGKFTLDFPDNPKILPLSDSAFRCLVEATLWSRKQLTDGWLATRLATAKWSLADMHELSTNDPVNPSLIEHENGWQIRDFADHQDTKAEVEERSRRNKLNGQRGGLANGKRPAKQSASDSLSESLAETETETEIKNKEQETCATSSRGCPSRFEDFWAVYPRRRDKRKAEKAFANALKRADVETIIAGADRYARDPNRAEQFTKYAEGWLNGDGWLDEPLPARNGAPAPVHKMRRLAELAAQQRAIEQQALEQPVRKELA